MFWKQRIKLARCKIVILRINVICLPLKFLLIHLWSIRKNIFFPPFLHILILTAFQSVLLSRINFFQKFLTTPILIKLWEYTKLLLRNTHQMMNFFLSAQSTAFVSENQNRQCANTIFYCVSYARVTSSEKIHEKNSGIEHVTAQSTEFLKTFHLIKQIEGRIEPNLIDNFDSCDIEILKNVLHVYHAAYFSCANWQLTLTTMHHSSNEIQSAVTVPRQIFTFNLPSRIWHWKTVLIENSYISNKRTFL